MVNRAHVRGLRMRKAMFCLLRDAPKAKEVYSQIPTRKPSISDKNYVVLLVMLQARIKKIMQTDEEVGKVAAAVPVIICIHIRNILFISVSV